MTHSLCRRPNRKLVESEIKFGYLQLSRLLDRFQDPLQPITIIDSDGETCTRKMHSEQRRIDGLTRLHKKHASRVGQTVTVEIKPRDPAFAHVRFLGRPAKGGGVKLKRLDNVSEGVARQAIEKSISSGAGFGSPERNRKVERAAVKFVTDWHKTRGWIVSSVEAEKRGYDLLCRKGSIENHVEVKGIKGKIPIPFIITAGEVRQSKSNPFFVVCAVF